MSRVTSTQTGDLGRKRVNVLGVGVSAVNLKSATEQIGAWVRARENARYICITGVHGVVESQSDADLKDIHNRAAMVTPDGMPLVWLARMHGNNHVTRVYGPDLMLAVCERFQAEGCKHYFYGGAEGVPEQLAARLKARFPQLEVVGTYSPPFRALTASEDAEEIAAINATGADIVWVGLSTPKQERWMAAHVARLEAPVVIGVGAAFDFHSGMKSQAPVWMQRNGLEWLYRMVTEPKRLGPRYLVSIPTFLWKIALHYLHVQRQPLDGSPT